MPWITEIAVRRLQASAQVTNHDDGPLVTLGVVLVCGIGKIDDQRVVHHRAFAFGDRFQFAHERGQFFAMPPTCPDMKFVRRRFLDGLLVTYFMRRNRPRTKIQLGSIERHPHLIPAGTGGNRGYIGKARNKGTGSNFELGFHPIEGKGLGSETLVTSGAALLMRSGVQRPCRPLIDSKAWR